jgi:anaerobic selenocysteine-containing dehydrogenase
MDPQAAVRLGISTDDRVRVRTRQASMKLKALVEPTIRPDTLSFRSTTATARRSIS